MARKKKTDSNQLPIEQYEHKDKQRLNNPPVGLVDSHTDNGGLKKKTYQYDPHLDPQLQWAGKAEHTSFDVPTVSLHVHERIDPRRIIESVQKEKEAPCQISLFEAEKKPLREAIEFYKHKENWSNRLIAGDSLLVMNSLLEKEGMGGKVQMVYFDPPYGIKYGSNFQPFVNKRDVKDGKDDDLTAEPEMIKAFRDTWELGIHSYLTYLRDRLLLARELLHESGSVFVQISDENIHLVKNILDELFGIENFVSIITLKKSGSQTAGLIPTICDYIIWYARDKEKSKYRGLFIEKNIGINDTEFNQIINSKGEYRTLTKEEKIKGITPDGFKVFKSTDLNSRSGSATTTLPYEFKGNKYYPRSGAGWRTNTDGLNKLEIQHRLIATENTL